MNKKRLLKTRARVQGPIEAYARRVTAWLSRVVQFNAFATREIAEKQMRQKGYPKGQWHRWYKANRQRQRLISSLKQMGDRREYRDLRRDQIP